MDLKCSGNSEQASSHLLNIGFKSLTVCWMKSSWHHPLVLPVPVLKQILVSRLAPYQVSSLFCNGRIPYLDVWVVPALGNDKNMVQHVCMLQQLLHLTTFVQTGSKILQTHLSINFCRLQVILCFCSHYLVDTASQTIECNKNENTSLYTVVENTFDQKYMCCLHSPVNGGANGFLFCKWHI